MHHRLLQMLLFIRHDFCNGRDRSIILPLQQVDLMLQVAQHYALYSSGRCSNRLQSKKCRYQAQCKSTQSAQPVAVATAGTSALKVVPEDGAMRFFMRLECLERWNDRWRSPSRDQDLSGVDIDSAMLPCMVHLKYSLGKVFRLHSLVNYLVPCVAQIIAPSALSSTALTPLDTFNDFLIPRRGTSTHKSISSLFCFIVFPGKPQIIDI